MHDEAHYNRTIILSLRLGFIALLLVWCFRIIEPFAIPVLWGIILAIGFYPVHKRLVSLLNNSQKIAALLFVLAGLTVIVIPAYLFAETTVDGLLNLARELETGSLKVPPPPDNVAGWPLIGPQLDEIWRLASSNLEAAIEKLEPQLKAYAPRLLTAAAGVGITVIQFIFSMIIAGIFLAKADAGAKAAGSVFSIVVGPQADEFTELASATIRSVVQGVLGVALIQSVLAGIGLLAVGFPGTREQTPRAHTGRIPSSHQWPEELEQGHQRRG